MFGMARVSDSFIASFPNTDSSAKHFLMGLHVSRDTLARYFVSVFGKDFSPTRSTALKPLLIIPDKRGNNCVGTSL